MTTKGRADRLVAVGVALTGVVMLVGAREIAFGIGYDRVGPRAFPYAIGLGLVVLGALLAVTRGGAREPSQVSPLATTHRGTVHRGALTTMVVALVAFVLLLERVGFVAAAAGQFALVARAFDSRRTLRDCVLGLALAAVVYFAFTSGLGAALPSFPGTTAQP